MTGWRAPNPVARLGVELASRLLRTRAARERYRAEFLAELHDLSPSGQIAHAAGVLSQTFALRAALSASPSGVLQEDAMTQKPSLGRRFLCHALRWHHWANTSNPDGERYRACTFCGTEYPPPAHWESGGVGGGL
jgi:hypothetical protein